MNNPLEKYSIDDLQAEINRKYSIKLCKRIKEEFKKSISIDFSFKSKDYLIGSYSFRKPEFIALMKELINE